MTRALLLWLIVPALVPAGCARRRETGSKPPPPPPLVMDAASAGAVRHWLARWRSEPARTGDGEVRYAFVIGESAPSGRRGYSRVTCRLVLQDPEYRSVRRDGRLRIVLVAAPNRSDERVVGGWQLSADTAGEHYRYGIMPGYLLDLVWPRVEGVTTYRLVVRWSDPEGEAGVTTTFHFEDVFGYDAQTMPTTP
ncbi:MAG: hypothetical protein ACOC95_09170 [Planctomycetota bacterium]